MSPIASSISLVPSRLAKMTGCTKSTRPVTMKDLRPLMPVVKVKGCFSDLVLRAILPLLVVEEDTKIRIVLYEFVSDT